MNAYFACLALALGANAHSPRALELPPPVPREFRAAWVTLIWDRGFVDWPSAELRAMLDHASAIGLNALILHVRLAGDAMYPTKYAPWSAFLTGTSGKAPSPAYDPLEFAVREAHQQAPFVEFGGVEFQAADHTDGFGSATQLA